MWGREGDNFRNNLTTVTLTLLSTHSTSLSQYRVEMGLRVPLDRMDTVVGMWVAEREALRTRILPRPPTM